MTIEVCMQVKKISKDKYLVDQAIDGEEAI
jgi:hypothetical protein